MPPARARCKLLLARVGGNGDHDPSVEAELDLDTSERGVGDSLLGHMRKMPNFVSGIGAFRAAEIPSASTRRVSSGSMIPSSQRRAVE
jgi:hypothetical protein